MHFQKPHHCDHWRPKCHPCPCEKPTTQPTQPTRPQNAPIHNVVYLVDEHNSSDPNFKPARNANTITRRYAWHYSNANLDNMNLGEVPDTINLHESIANPSKNKDFKWEGFMFDIPGGAGVCRVGIVANADKIPDDKVTGPGGKAGEQVDRVIGFAGSYMDNTIPIGPIVQVRRDDKYRCLARSIDKKVSYYCAYYISKDTPSRPTGFSGAPTLAADENPSALDNPSAASDQQDTDATVKDSPLNYDQLMDENVKDNVTFAPGADPWTGNTFSFNADALDPGNENDDPLTFVFEGSALEDLQHSEEHFDDAANGA